MLTDTHFDTKSAIPTESLGVVQRIGYTTIDILEPESDIIIETTEANNHFKQNAQILTVLVPDEGEKIEDIQADLTDSYEQTYASGDHPIGRRRVYLIASAVGSPIIIARMKKLKHGETSIPEAMVISYDKSMKNTDGERFTEEEMRAVIQKILGKIDEIRIQRQQDITRRSMIFE